MGILALALLLTAETLVGASAFGRMLAEQARAMVRAWVGFRSCRPDGFREFLHPSGLSRAKRAWR